MLGTISESPKPAEAGLWGTVISDPLEWSCRALSSLQKPVPGSLDKLQEKHFQCQGNTCHSTYLGILTEHGHLGIASHTPLRAFDAEATQSKPIKLAGVVDRI